MESAEGSVSENRGMQLAGYFLTGGLGYAAGYFLPHSWLPYDSILISYHLYIAWLLVNADHKVGLSLPISTTILTHLSCLTLVIVLGANRNHIPFFWLIRYFIPALAPFEIKWIFGGEKRRQRDLLKAKTAVEAPASQTIMSSTGDEFGDWQRHCAKQKQPFPRPGVSLKDEYERWLLARAKSPTA